MYYKNVRMIIFYLVMIFILAACGSSADDVIDDEILLPDDAKSSISDITYELKEPDIVTELPFNEEPIIEVLYNPIVPEYFFSTYTELLSDERIENAEYWVKAAILSGAEGIEPDVNMLTEFYETTNDFSILRLFAARFCDSLNTEDELNISSNTALSLSNYLLQNEGVYKLFQPVSDSDRTKWLESIGVFREYTDPYEGYLDSFIISGLNPLIAETEGARFDLATYSVPRSDIQGFDTAEKMEYFLYREMHGKNYIVNWLNENAGDNISQVIIPAKIRYLSRPNIIRNSAYWVTQDININSSMSAHLHEYIHIILRHTSTSSNWRSEGLADFLTFIYPYNYRRIFFEEENFLFMLSDNGDDKYVDIIKETYYKYTGNELKSFPDMRALSDAYSYTYLTNTDGRLNLYLYFRPFYQVYNESRDVDGSELSYALSPSFIAYLTDIYSFETVLQLNESWVSVDSIFGKSYDELKNDWILWLTRYD